jgi:hypothetical protein
MRNSRSKVFNNKVRENDGVQLVIRFQFVVFCLGLFFFSFLCFRRSRSPVLRVEEKNEKAFFCVLAGFCVFNGRFHQYFRGPYHFFCGLRKLTLVSYRSKNAAAAAAARRVRAARAVIQPTQRPPRSI